MRQQIEFLKMLVANGGPRENQYEELNRFFKNFNQLRQQKIITDNDMAGIWHELSDAFYTTETMQGYAVLKPHGYAGDFVIIERIYQHWLSPKEHLINWDHFFHAQDAPRAILNRKKYFLGILKDLEKKDGKRDVLNIGCGPCQDVVEFLSQGPSQVFFECVDYDKNAIEYSYNKVKAKGFLGNIEFYRDNAFKFRPTRQYDLIWSAGLFDYLDEKTFKMLLTKQLAFLKEGGEIVLGNFSQNNSTRDYMEFGNWFLHHRSEDELIQIAVDCGVPVNNIDVRSEPLGVNFFLHISK